MFIKVDCGEFSISENKPLTIFKNQLTLSYDETAKADLSSIRENANVI